MRASPTNNLIKFKRKTTSIYTCINKKFNFYDGVLDNNNGTSMAATTKTV